MIAITAYDASMDRKECDHGQLYTAYAPREPVATIRVTIIASGADLDKFMAMLETVTGQRQPDPRNGHGARTMLGGGTIETR